MENTKSDAMLRALRMEALLEDLGTVVTEAEQRVCGGNDDSMPHVVGEANGTLLLDEVTRPLAAAAAARRVMKLHDLLQRRPGRGRRDRVLPAQVAIGVHQHGGSAEDQQPRRGGDQTPCQCGGCVKQRVLDLLRGASRKHWPRI